jgi:hypothetical protein
MSTCHNQIKIIAPESPIPYLCAMNLAHLQQMRDALVAMRSDEALHAMAWAENDWFLRSWIGLMRMAWN